MPNMTYFLFIIDQASVLTYAAMAAKWKEPARDALDRLTLGSVDMVSALRTIWLEQTER